MAIRRVVVIGSGRRAQETLPAFFLEPAAFQVQAVLARTPKQIACAGQTLEARPLAELATLDGVDLVYVAVSKPAVPEVLQRLVDLGPQRTDLLVDTPVVLLKHLHHADLAARFRNAWVAEDGACLPWFDLVKQAEAHGPLGRLREVRFLHSAYRYHAIAMMKVLFDAPVQAARRSRSGTGAVLTMHFGAGRRGILVEPRDYARGTVHLLGTQGRAGDDPTDAGAIQFQLVIEQGACVALRLGPHEVLLDPAESRLMGSDGGTTLTSRMEGLKRVGFLRLLRRIHNGQGAWRIQEGLDDMVIDEITDRARWYWPGMGIKSKLGRRLLTEVSRLASR